jgi:RNA 3'-terminal phosphate cyclase (ATP)
MLVIDGAWGEGGGEILRSSLALSVATGKPFRIERIRAARAKPGLMRQHLTAVEAAALISGAEVTGAELGSTSLAFTPGAARPGSYRFSIGTAGSTTLVLQTILPPLLLAPGASRIVLEGGTHNPGAPPFDFLEKTYLPIVERMGPRVAARLARPGFHPAGGGRLEVEVEPVVSLRGLELLERGALRRRAGRAVIANLPRHIAEREVKVLQKRLGWLPGSFTVEEVSGSSGPGNVVIIEIESEQVCEVITAFGALGRPAESVAGDAVRQCRAYLRSEAPVGEHLADQILLPLALAGRGRFRTRGLSRHATTQIDLLRRFLEIEIAVEEIAVDGGRVDGGGDRGDVVVTVGAGGRPAAGLRA